MANNVERLADVLKKRKSATAQNDANSSVNKLKKKRLENTARLDTLDDDLKVLGTTVESIYNGWQPKDTMDSTKASVLAMQERLNAYQEYAKLFGGEDVTELAKGYQAILEDWDNLSSVYGQYKNADAYNAASKKVQLEKQFSHKDGSGYTFDEVQAELKKYAPDSDEYKYLSTYTNYSNLDDFYKAQENNGELEEINNTISQWESYKKRAENEYKSKAKAGGQAVNAYNEWQKKVAEADREIKKLEDSKNSGYTGELTRKKNLHELEHKVDLYKPEYEGKADFEENSKYVTTYNENKKNGWLDYPLKYEDLTYEYINDVNGAREEIQMTDEAFNKNSNGYMSKWQKAGYDLLREDEIAIYNYKYRVEGKDSAEKFLKDMQTVLDKRRTDKLSKNWEQNAEDLPILSNAATVMLKPVGAIVGVVDDVVNKAQGKDYNPYSFAKTAINYVSDTRKYTSENIAENTSFELFGQNIPSFLYNTGMSIADSVYGVATVGKFNSVIMGTSAYQEKAKEMVEAGESEAVIWQSAITSGVAETLFEYIGIENLFKIKTVDSLSSFVKNALKQAGAESFEEIGTEITNIIADDVIRGENSELYQMYKDLIARGYSEDEALTKTALQAGSQVVWAGIGGALSGIGIGGVAAGKNYTENKTIGKEIRGNERVSDMWKIASMSPQESNAYAAYTEYAKQGVNAENITDAQLGNLYGMAEADAVSNVLSKKTTKEQKTDAETTYNRLSKMKTENKSAQIEKKLAQTDEEGVVTPATREAVINELADGMSEAEANLFRLVDDGHSNVDDYSNSFKLVVDLARNDFSQDYILEHRGVLSTGQVNSIYQSVVTNPKMAQQKRLEALIAEQGDNLEIKGTIDDSVIDYANTGAKGKVNWNSLHPNVKATIAYVSGFSTKVAGMDVQLVTNGREYGFTGQYDRQGNTMLVDITALTERVKTADTKGRKDNSKFIISTVAHEVTHWMEEKAPELYAEYSKMVMDALATNGRTEADVLGRRRALLEKAEAKRAEKENRKPREITDAEVRREVIARASEDMLALSEEGKKFFESLSQNEQKQFVDKIKEVIQNIKGWIKNVLSNLTSDTPEAVELRLLAKDLDAISKKWDEMLRQAAKSNAAMKKAGINDKAIMESKADVTTQNADIDETHGNFIRDKYFDRQIDKIETLKEGGYVTVGEIKTDSPINKVGIPAGNLYFDVSKIRQEMIDRKDNIPPEIMKGIPTILDNPILITEYKDNNGIPSINVYGNLFIGSSPVVVGIMIGKHRNGSAVDKIQTVHPNRNVLSEATDENTLYLGENKKETKAWFQALGTQVLPLGGTKFGFIRSINQNAPKVKSFVQYSDIDTEYMDAVESGNMDKVQKMVDEAAKRAGYDVDNEGRPDLLFHGTDSFGFTKPDLSNSDDGATFWATPNMGVAGSYYEGSNYRIREIGKEKVVPKGEKLYHNTSMEKAISAHKQIRSELSQDINKLKYPKESVVMKKAKKPMENAVRYSKTVLNGDFPTSIKKIAQKVVDAYNQGTYDAWAKAINSFSFQQYEEETGVNFSEIELEDNFNIDRSDVSKITQVDPNVFKMMYHIGDTLDALGKDDYSKLRGEKVFKVDIIDNYNKSVAEKGIYGLYHKQSNPFVYDCQGSQWNEIPVPSEAVGYFAKETTNTRQIAGWAFSNGYDSIKLENVIDVGGYALKEAQSPNTVWAFKDPAAQLKSADPITYDDNGNVIPLSKRFDASNKEDIRYSDIDSEYDAETQAEINQTMTMQQAKDMIQRAFVTGMIEDFYDGQYKNGDEWLAGEGADEVAFYIENEYSIVTKYLNHIQGYIDEDFQLQDILNAYTNKALTGKVKKATQWMDLSEGVSVADKRFYAPREIKNAKKKLEIAKQKIDKSNKKEVTKARAEILLYAHNKGAAETLGLTESELNKMLRQWGGYSASAREVSMRFNNNVALSNRWTGIENSSWLNSVQVSEKELARLVKSIEGDSQGFERNYIARTMLALDTHIDWSNLKFVFTGVVDPKRTNVRGTYDAGEKLIRASYNSPNTVAHEMGHALDNMWAMELGFGNYGHMTDGTTNLSRIENEQAREWYSHFQDFIHDLTDGADIRSSYSMDNGEVFARFVSSFVQWVDITATGRKNFGFYDTSKYSGDNFQAKHYLAFVKILQEKAMLDSKSMSAATDVQYSDIDELDDLNAQLKEKQNQVYAASMELRKFDVKSAEEKLYAAMEKKDISTEEMEKAMQEYSNWATESGYGDASERLSALKDEEKLLRREIQKVEDRLHDELKEQIAHWSDEDVKKYVSKAVRKYHTTTRLDKASYLVTTGSMLDFSDGQSYRVKDHREISEILDLPDYAEYSDGMIAFMNMGNIRLQTYGIDVSVMPNAKQFSALRDIIFTVMRENDEFSVDFSKTDGYSAGSVTYGKGTSTSKIIADIKSYFETGVVPEEQSNIRDFLYSDIDPEVDIYEVLGENKRLQKENKKLHEDFDRLMERQKLEKQLTHGKILNKNQLDAVAGHIRNIANSNYSKTELVKKLDEVYTWLATSKDVTWDDLFARLYGIAEDVLAESSVTVTNDYYANIYKDIRNTEISLSESQKKYVKDMLGVNWNKAFFGKIKVSDNGIPLNSKWEEWREKYPNIFTEEQPLDQALELLEIYDTSKELKEVVEEYTDVEQARWLANELYNQYWNVSTIRTTADRYDQKIKRLNYEHRNAMRELRDSYNERLAKQKKSDKELRDNIFKKLREDHKKELQEVRQRGKERLDKYKEEAARKTRIHSITGNALTLNEWLVKNSKDKHIHDSMKGPVIALLQAIDFSSKRALGMWGGDMSGVPTNKDISLQKALSQVQQMMADASVGKEELVLLYGHELDADIKSMIESVDNIMRTVGDNEFILNKMTLDDLNTLDNVVKTIKHAVTQMNKFHIVNHAKGVANLAQEEILYAEKLGKATIYKDKSLKAGVKKLLAWKNINPYYAFKRFGAAGKKVFEAFQDGYDKFAFNIKEIIDFTNSTYKAKEVQDWEKEIKSFKLRMPVTEDEMSQPDYEPQYQEVQMTVAQIMDLYLLNKREAAKLHLLGGGIRVADIETKGGKVISQSEGAILEQSEIDEIIKSLTPRQIEVADALSKFMNTTSSDWGNVVSMARFGYKAFGEKNYVPMQVDKNNLAVDDETEKNNSLFRLLNMSFTKALTEKADNRLVVSSIFDVFAQHTSDMAKYNALALPVLDAFRWYNYKEKGFKGETAFVTKSVKQAIENAFGKDGQSYITTFLKDLNGQENTSRDTLGRGFFTKAKIAAVAGNLRVALLQPTAYLKASANIDSKYLLKALMHKPKIAHAEKYCGMALWKSLGYFDTNVQRGVAEQIKHAETKYDKAVELSMKGAEWGDKITFGYLWNAAELEIREKRQDLKVGSDEFFLEVGKRLRDIIYSTQVVDSVMTRSEMMRSPDWGDKLITTFASEPTIAYNMLADAVLQTQLDARELGSKKAATRKNAKYMARVVVAYTTTNLVAALVESGFDVLRDDDDEEMDAAEFMKLYLENFATNQSILAKIPWLNEAVSIMQGFSSTRMDTQGMQTFANALKQVMKLTQGEGNWGKAIKSAVQTVSYLSGLPFYNAWRDLWASIDKFIVTDEELEEILREFY